MQINACNPIASQKGQLLKHHVFARWSKRALKRKHMKANGFNKSADSGLVVCLVAGSGQSGQMSADVMNNVTCEQPLHHFARMILLFFSWGSTRIQGVRGHCICQLNLSSACGLAFLPRLGLRPHISYPFRLIFVLISKSFSMKKLSKHQ